MPVTYRSFEAINCPSDDLPPQVCTWQHNNQLQRSGNQMETARNTGLTVEACKRKRTRGSRDNVPQLLANDDSATFCCSGESELYFSRYRNRLWSFLARMVPTDSDSICCNIPARLMLKLSSFGDKKQRLHTIKQLYNKIRCERSRYHQTHQESANILYSRNHKTKNINACENTPHLRHRNSRICGTE